jgi:hypothetical protein
MSKVRINDLARELEVKSGAILEALPLVGVIEKKSHSSALEEEEAARVRVYFHLLPDSQTRPLRVTPNVPQQSLSELRISSSPSTSMARMVTESERPVHPDQLSEISLALPEPFSFYNRGFLDFDHVLGHLDWDLRDRSVTVDLSVCMRSNFQALVLLIQYVWHLTLNGCAVKFKYGTAQTGPTKMLAKMGALDWREVLFNDGRDFGNKPSRKTYALRRRSDVQSTINNARSEIQSYTIGFPKYLSYIISELLYNATEHGRRVAGAQNCQVLVPAIFQFRLYPQLNRLSFIFSDLGIGVKNHLEQAYPPFSTNQEAIMHALRPNVSGTFQQQSEPYAAKNNAGMGLTYSSQLLKRLRGDMYIVSHDAVVHVSPEDVTSHQLRGKWPGTFVLINLNVGEAPSISLEDLMSEIRMSAEKEMNGASEREQSDRYVVNVSNYFGKYAEDKDAAIKFRDRHILPAIEQGKKIDLDFREVETAPHSFLNALLATPVQRLGLKAYQRIRIYNALGSIHEIIDKVLEDNVPKIQS